MITPRKLTCCTWRPGSPDCSRPQWCRPGKRGTWARPLSHHPGWPAAGSAGYDAAAIPGKEILSQGLGYDTHLQLALWTSKITSSATWRLRQIFLLSRGCSCSARCGSTSWKKISTVKFLWLRHKEYLENSQQTVCVVCSIVKFTWSYLEKIGK